MPILSRLSALVLVLALLLPGAARGEMYEYVDSEGRVHFTQDIGQVPPQYRNQVARKELRKEISVTGSEKAGGDVDRVRAMEMRARALRRAARHRERQQAVPAARRAARTARKPTPEPRKYWRDCSDAGPGERCRRVLTEEWKRWNAANGGNNGKPVIRRRVGDD